MKVVDIYVIGKYEYKTQTGNWIFYMTHRGAVMKQSGFIEKAGSPTRVALYALLQAINRINEPCNLKIHSKTNLGFMSMQTSKNKDLLVVIQRQIVNAGHLFSHDTNFPSEQIEKWEEENRLKQENKRKAEIEQERKRKAEEEAYDRHIEEQAMQSEDWRAMYSDLMGPSEGRWVPGSGGY